MPILSNITFNITNRVYLKSPETSELGRKILQGSILLIDEIGFEEFTFKKLAKKISSTEASIYRYFTSKHMLLAYLILWFWNWQQYRLILKTTNITDPKIKLSRAIEILTETITVDENFGAFNTILLHKIVISESSKFFLNKTVDSDNRLGLFQQYKDLVQLVCNIILEINPTYKYPHILVSTIIEGSHHQRFYAEHLPRLTDNIKGEDAISNFYNELVFKSIEQH